MGGGGQGTWSTVSEDPGAREAAVVCGEAGADEAGVVERMVRKCR